MGFNSGFKGLIKERKRRLRKNIAGKERQRQFSLIYGEKRPN